MKTIKCSEVGGDTCGFEVTAATMEDAMDQFSTHAKVAHADMMEKATPESIAEWRSKFAKIWDSTPDNV